MPNVRRDTLEKYIKSSLHLVVSEDSAVNVLQKIYDTVTQFINLSKSNLDTTLLTKLQLIKDIAKKRLDVHNTHPVSILEALSKQDDIKVIIDEYKLNDYITKSLYDLRIDLKILDNFYSFVKLEKINDNLKSLIYETEYSDDIPIEEIYQKLREKFQNIVRNIHEINSSDSNDTLVLDPSTIDNIEETLYNAVPSAKIRVPTYFSGLNEAFKGGYIPGRIYIWAGPSGHGKSTILLNCLASAVELYRSNIEETFKEIYPGYEPVVYYFTNENSIQETWDRLASILTDDASFTEGDLSSIDPELLERLKTIIKESGVGIVIKYIKPYNVTAYDIKYMIENSSVNTKPLLVIVDYMDRLNSSMKTEHERLRLGYIVDELKSISIDLSIPVITATQLNRESLRDKNKPADITTISESWKKVENADVVLLFKTQFKATTSEYVSDVVIGKHRYNKKIDPNKIYKLSQSADGSYRLREIVDSSFDVGFGTPSSPLDTMDLDVF